MNRTDVPFWTELPFDSETNAESVVVPPVARARCAAVRVIVELDGATSGTLSHAASVQASATIMPRWPRHRDPDCIE